ncbi:ComEC/Rec2 family competence protein [Burkholderia gladioli]|uniref:ComEC/Rec2 family competence protein n=1 Tax=Burkholderia gladioli TaxID=28095 RepID=UPI0022D14AD7|nr:hypothetical protein [Burkholderia gladioli]MDA0576176.1 hypothetical protein [Burkholderia gladioli]MDA0604270.1 hypothetical protein [Burkholderia gladioli]
MKNGSEAKLKVELINVGHGDSLLLHWTPEKGDVSTILIDGGPAAGGRRIKETLDRINAAAIDLAVLTHCDADHVDGLLAYVKHDDRLPIHRYWGPCLPAFERHSWLFPGRIKRGLDQTKALQEALGSDCAVSWPVEGANWVSPDGGLSIKVLSPAGRLIERLLLGDDSLSLFLQQPTPLGWLLSEAASPPPIEDAFADLRFAISTGEITPNRVPAGLPRTPRLASAEEFASQAAQQGVDPEFLGNCVLNDTSIVLLVEARLGVVHRRLLFTGDLENFTYLMARWPMGLGCEVVKAPHHGSYSFVDRDKAYDAVWQWLRPRAVLLSANGKHGLPRSDFRDAALRYGATLFCTSRRSREIVSGPITEACCNTQYACRKSEQAPVSLSITSMGIDADGIACARGNLSGVMPVIEVRQHLVEQSPILSTLAETEIRKHMEWAVDWLRKTLERRRGRPPRPDLEPLSLDVMRKAAVAAGRLAAAVEIELILERAAREGKVWLSDADRFRSRDRQVWIMPDSPDITAIKRWIDRYLVVQLAVKDPSTGSGVEELLFAADTDWLADRFAEELLFPRAMFDGAIWPRMVAHLLRTRSIGVRTLTSNVKNNFGATTIMALFKGKSVDDVARALAEKFKSVPDQLALRDYLKASRRTLYELSYQNLLEWPVALEEVASPLWLGRLLPPGGLMQERYGPYMSPVGTLEDVEHAVIEKWIQRGKQGDDKASLPDELVPAALAGLMLGGFSVLSHASAHKIRTSN